MHDVSNAINILDPSNNTDKAICKAGAYVMSGASSQGDELKDHCGVKDSSHNSGTTGVGLSLLFKTPTSNDATGTGGGYPKDGTLIGNETSSKISKDIRELNREQHGVASSAFAKAHEGAEIVEARVLTVAIMDGGGTI